MKGNDRYNGPYVWKTTWHDGHESSAWVDDKGELHINGRVSARDLSRLLARDYARLCSEMSMAGLQTHMVQAHSKSGGGKELKEVEG